MLPLIKQIRSGKLWDFPGGIHPAGNKSQSNQHPPVMASLPNELTIPIKQHIGKPGDLLISVGSHVKKGQPLTQASSPLMLPVHAPTSGVITAIEPRTIPHPSGLDELAIILQPDGHEQWYQQPPIQDYTKQTPEQLMEVIRQAGISGLGGAGFPTAKKLQVGLAKTDILIINAAECEPYITADDVLMRHYAEGIVEGIHILEHILTPKLVIIAIEDNKTEAIKALEIAAITTDYVIRVIPTKYPSGGEKQLIKILTNLEVPSGKLPVDINIAVQNVGTTYAIKQAVMDGIPLIQRLVTLTGKTFKQPRNVWALVGTPIQSLLDEFGYQPDKKQQRLISGGSMMGFTLPHANVPITKTTNCILAPKAKEIAPATSEMPCIRCGQCADVCPVSLLPQQLQWHAKAEEYDKCEQLNLKDCIECGACAYVCPSNIPLVQYYRQAKAEIRTRLSDSLAAERAKVRFEHKKRRQEQEKLKRQQRAKTAIRTQSKVLKTEDGGDAIAAAIARVQAQKSAQEPTVKPAVAAAIAKAKAQQEAARNQSSSAPDNREMAKLREKRKQLARERKAARQVETIANEPEQPTDASNKNKKSAVEAAIARAKARKALQQQAVEDRSTTQHAEKTDASAPNDKQSAVARAKARKAQQQQAVEDRSTTQHAEKTDASAPNDRQSAVAAAVARAKARKAQQQQAVEDRSTTQHTEKTDASAPNDRQSAVAAAVARAKARKAQQQHNSDNHSEEKE